MLYRLLSRFPEFAGAIVNDLRYSRQRRGDDGESAGCRLKQSIRQAFHMRWNNE